MTSYLVIVSLYIVILNYQKNRYLGQKNQVKLYIYEFMCMWSVFKIKKIIIASDLRVRF